MTHWLFPVSMPLLQITNVYFTHTNKFILRSLSIRMNVSWFFFLGWGGGLEGALTVFYTCETMWNVAIFTNKRAAPSVFVFRDWPRKWVGLKQLVCHSNLSTAAVLWIWLHLAKKSPRVAWQPAIAPVSVALHGCQILSERSFILQTQWEKNTQVSAREAVCVILKLYIHSG